MVNMAAVSSTATTTPRIDDPIFMAVPPGRSRIEDRRKDLGIGRRDAVLDGPEIPVVDDRAGQQDADAAGERAEHREPPGPAMDRFHRGVEAHRPAPEQRGALGRRAAIDDLLDLALAAVAARPRGSSRRASRTAASSRTGRRSRACGTGCRTGCRSGSRRPRSSRDAGRCRTAPPRSSCPSAAAG